MHLKQLSKLIAISIFVCSFCLTSIASFAQNTKKTSTKTTTKPIITFEATYYLADTLEEGQEVMHYFNFENTGNAPLIIKNATATCGCTQPTFPFIPIMPGEKSRIGMRFNSRTKFGVQKPSISVFTNASKQPKILVLETFVKTKNKN
ncbi:MAG: DUF1573 domain-containing protein [Saprospiraceae bacterium]|nr:DUF1573 domain-containing protein [Saprospiraceae bacterium]